MKPLTKRMIAVLEVLAVNAKRSVTPNDIARRLGFLTGHVRGKPQCNHAGRTMGPAQRIIFSLIGLRKRGLITYGKRSDGLSGTAYTITSSGLIWWDSWVSPPHDRLADRGGE